MPEMKLPVEWAQAKNTPWKLACLAASVCGWDPQQDDGQVTEDDYFTGLEAAKMKLEACRAEASKLADSTAASRVCIVEHPIAMAAIVAHKPSVTEVLAQIAMEQAADDPRHLQLEKSAYFLWSRVLWPEAAGKAQIMNEWPIDYTLHYPNRFMESMRISPVDVRKKHLR